MHFKFKISYISSVILVAWKFLEFKFLVYEQYMNLKRDHIIMKLKFFI